MKCAHLNFIPMTSPPAQLGGKFTLSAEDEAGVARGKEFVANGTGYSTEHRTRPATISFLVSSSPVALLSWASTFLKQTAW